MPTCGRAMSTTCWPATSKPEADGSGGSATHRAWDQSPDVETSHTGPSPGLLGDRSFRSGIAALSRAGLSFDAWLYHPQLLELADLAAAHPDVSIVLDHLGGPLGVGPYSDRRPAVLDDWRRGMAELRPAARTCR